LYFPTKEYDWNWFWTGALRDEGSTAWYWEETGAEITEFYWGFGQPSMDQDLVRSCIDFSFTSGGWDDDSCESFLLLDVMCE